MKARGSEFIKQFLITKKYKSVMKEIIVFALCICSYQKLFSQYTGIDALKKKLSQSNDTAKINVLIDLSGAYKDLYANAKNDTDLNSSRHFANDALASSRKINYIKGIGYSLFNLAEVASQAPENQLAALEDYQMALPFLKKDGDKYMIAA